MGERGKEEKAKNENVHNFNALYFSNVINQLMLDTFRIISYEDISIA